MDETHRIVKCCFQGFQNAISRSHVDGDGSPRHGRTRKRGKGVVDGMEWGETGSQEAQTPTCTTPHVDSGVVSHSAREMTEMSGSDLHHSAKGSKFGMRGDDEFPHITYCPANIVSIAFFDIGTEADMIRSIPFRILCS